MNRNFSWQKNLWQLIAINLALALAKISTVALGISYALVAEGFSQPRISS